MLTGKMTKNPSSPQISLLHNKMTIIYIKKELMARESGRKEDLD